MRIILFHTDEILAAALSERLCAAHAGVCIDDYYCLESGDDIQPAPRGKTFDPFYHSWTQPATADVVLNVVNRAIRSDEYCYERYHFGLPGLLLANRHFLGNPYILHVSAPGKAAGTVDTENMSAQNDWLLSRNKGDALLRSEPRVEIIACPLFRAAESRPRGLFAGLFGAAPPAAARHGNENFEREVDKLARRIGDSLERLAEVHPRLRPQGDCVAAAEHGEAMEADSAPQRGDQKAA